MSFLPNIFGRSSAAPQSNPAQQVPAVQQASAQQTPANPSADPAVMVTPAAPAASTPPNPLDSFADMFKPKAPDPNAKQVPTLADPILSPLDPTEFNTQVSQANFASKIPPAVIQKALGGDAEAFQQALNQVAQETFAAAAQLSHGLVEYGSRTAADRVNNSVDSRIKNFQIRTQNTSHQALTHPAVAPMLNAVKMQLASSNPNLTPQQIQEQAETYFTQMAEVLVAPKRQAAEQAAKPKGTDFSHLLNP